MSEFVVCVFLTALCVYISRRAVCYEVIVSCRGVKHGKGHAGGELSAKGLSCRLSKPVAKQGEERVSGDDVCHAVLAPPLAAVPAVLGRQLPPLISLLLLSYSL